MATPPPREPAELAERVKDALESADLDKIGELLAPDVTWGAPGDPNPACRNRDQVPTWYRQGRNAGARARVVEMEERGGKYLVGLRVDGGAEAGTFDRWQVLTIRDGLIGDIRGYPDRDEACAAL